MNKKNLVSFTLFGISVFILTINFLVELELSSNYDLWWLIFLSGVLAYVIIYFIYVVIIQHYSKWKIFFYDDRINYIRHSVKRQRKPLDDFGGIFFLSMIINFFTVYFLLITTPNQIISRIPGFEGIELFLGNSNIDFYEYMISFTRIDYFLPLTIFGVSVFFILRFIHHRRINNEREGYPGTNPLLAFMYAVLGIIGIQGIILASGIVDMGITLDIFTERILFAGIFTILSVFTIPVSFLLDRFFLKNMQIK